MQPDIPTFRSAILDLGLHSHSVAAFGSWKRCPLRLNWGANPTLPSQTSKPGGQTFPTADWGAATGQAAPSHRFRVSDISAGVGIVVTELGPVATVGFNDERYFKLRTTVVCLTLSAILWDGLARGRA